jgi:TctA family transporter
VQICAQHKPGQQRLLFNATTAASSVAIVVVVVGVFIISANVAMNAKVGHDERVGRLARVAGEEDAARPGCITAAAAAGAHHRELSV